MTCTIKGPVVGGGHGWPYTATLVDLDAVGSIEVEAAEVDDRHSVRRHGPPGCGMDA